MPTAINLWPLLGVAVIIVGFILRFNPMLVVIVTAIGTAFAASVNDSTDIHREKLTIRLPGAKVHHTGGPGSFNMEGRRT